MALFQGSIKALPGTQSVSFSRAGASSARGSPTVLAAAACLRHAYVSIRQHTSAYVSIQHTSAYVSIQHTSAGASCAHRSPTVSASDSACLRRCHDWHDRRQLAYVGRHTSVSIRSHTSASLIKHSADWRDRRASAYVSIREHT